MIKEAMRKKTVDSSDATREQLLNASAKLFRKHGYASITLRQIADETGIKAGSIYYHFSSKDDLVLEVLEAGIKMVSDAVREGVEALPKDAPPQEKIAAAIHGHLFGLLAHGDFTSANVRIYGQVPSPIKRKHRISRAAYARYWDSVLSEAKERGVLRSDMPIAMIRMFTLGALNWTVEWFDPQQNTVKEFADHITGVVLSGITDSRSAFSQRGRASRKSLDKVL